MDARVVGTSRGHRHRRLTEITPRRYNNEHMAGEPLSRCVHRGCPVRFTTGPSRSCGSHESDTSELRRIMAAPDNGTLLGRMKAAIGTPAADEADSA